VCAIGCGNIATGYHGPAYARYAAEHPGTLLAACCDIDAGRAARFAGAFGFARHYTDFERMLDEERPGAVCLSAPPERTTELACRILERGFPLLTEKPPGLTVAAVDRMLAAEAAGGAPCFVAFNRRHMPLARALRRWLAEAGPPQAVLHARYTMVRIGRADPDFSTTAVHGVDAARFLAGSDYARIRFRYQPLPELGPAVANLFLDCEFASGATGQLAFLPAAGAVTERAEVHLRDATCELRLPVWGGYDAPGRLVILRRGEPVLDVDGPAACGTREDIVLAGFYSEDAAFFDAVRAGPPAAGDLRDARQSVAVMQCLRERRSEYRA
jgi:predicted dehydrogenase